MECSGNDGQSVNGITRSICTWRHRMRYVRVCNMATAGCVCVLLPALLLPTIVGRTSSGLEIPCAVTPPCFLTSDFRRGSATCFFPQQPRMRDRSEGPVANACRNRVGCSGWLSRNLAA